MAFFTQRLWRPIGATRIALYGKILKDAKPADQSVQQSTNFELVANLKPGEALGLTGSPSILALAGKVSKQAARIYRADQRSREITADRRFRTTIGSFEVDSGYVLGGGAERFVLKAGGIEFGGTALDPRPPISAR